MLKQPDWQVLYAAAMLETDTAQLQQRIELAHAAIRARLQELPQNQSPESERAELQYALNYLRRLDVA